MKKVPVEEAVGMILAHDMTKIVPDQYKGIAFHKGHILEERDIELLKDMGKFHIYIFEMHPEDLHENDAALRVARAIAGPNINLEKPGEGKVNLSAKIDGRLSINLEGLDYINNEEGIICATRHRNLMLKEGERLAGAKIIPLSIDKAHIERIETYCRDNGPVIDMAPLVKKRAGILVTGSEVYYGRIKDAFAPVLAKKVDDYKSQVVDTLFAPDDETMIQQKIQELLAMGCDLVMVSGGMSVDPDDLTPRVIRSLASQVVTYGSPVLPGAMFMMAYKEETPILGVPACGMFNKTTVLDLVLPYIFTNKKVERKDILKMAHGGLCMQCETCVYPDCPFGKY